MPRLLLLTHEFPPFRGGVAVYTQEMARAAHAAGYNVTVVAPSYGKSLEKTDEQDFPFRVRRFKGGTFSPSQLPGLLLRTAGIVSRQNADIVHAVDWPFVMALAFLKKFRNRHFLATVHGSDCLALKDSSLVKLLGVSGMYATADRVIANSDFTRHLLLNNFPETDDDRIIFAHLGVNPSWFGTVDQSSIRIIRDRYGIKPGKKIILTVARLDERKGHSSVIEALRILPENTKQDLTYVIVGGLGSRDYVERLQRIAINCGVPVIFTGELSDEDLHRFYGCATVFCMPGDLDAGGVEGFGLTYLEAAAMGVPSIAFKISAMPEVIRDGETGLLVSYKDIQALSASIQKLVTDPGEVSRLGSAAREWASKFTWARCVELTYGNIHTGHPT